LNVHRKFFSAAKQNSDTMSLKRYATELHHIMVAGAGVGWIVPSHFIHAVSNAPAVRAKLDVEVKSVGNAPLSPLAYKA